MCTGSTAPDKFEILSVSLLKEMFAFIAAKNFFLLPLYAAPIIRIAAIPQQMRSLVYE